MSRSPVPSPADSLDADAPDPERTPAARRMLEVSVGVEHVPACSALLEERDRRW